MAATLQHFTGSDLRLNQQQARRTLKFFFPSTDIDHVNITDDDRSFAQALLIEAINASEEMGYVKILFDKLYTPPVDFGYIQDLAKQVVKYGLVTWFRRTTGDFFKNPKIYLIVRDQLAFNFSTVWNIRLQTGELTY